MALFSKETTRTRPRVATTTKERAPMQGVYQGLYNTDPPDVDALLDAVEAGNMDRVRELLDGGDVGVNEADAGGCTALHGAAQGGDVALVEHAHRGRGDGRPGRWRTAAPRSTSPPTRASWRSSRRSSRPRRRSTRPRRTAHTALHRLPEGNLEVVKVLIEAKAKVNQAKENGATPLFIASQKGKLEVVKVLIEAKAKVNQARGDGATPLYTASQQGPPPGRPGAHRGAGARSAELPGATATRPLLHRLPGTAAWQVVKRAHRGSKPRRSTRPSEDSTYTRSAPRLKNAHLEAVPALLPAKANVNQAAAYGCTHDLRPGLPRRADLEVVQALIESGATVRPGTWRTAPPLSAAPPITAAWRSPRRTTRPTWRSCSQAHGGRLHPALTCMRRPRCGRGRVHGSCQRELHRRESDGWRE